jgi:hypothetical protein
MRAMLAFQRRLLKRASEICGGYDTLCVRLGVSEHSLQLWLEAKAQLPERIFLKASDIVLEDDVARAAQDRRTQPRVDAAGSANSDTFHPVA